MGKEVQFRTRSDGSRYPINEKPKNSYYLPYTRDNTHPTNCQYCHKQIYFYSNDDGSKVFFEALGQPWPKHECEGMLRAYRKERAQSKKRRNKTTCPHCYHWVYLFPSKSGVKAYYDSPDRHIPHRCSRSEGSSGSRRSSAKSASPEKKQQETQTPVSANPVHSDSLNSTTLIKGFNGSRTLKLEPVLLEQIQNFYVLFRRDSIYTDYLFRKGVVVVKGHQLQLKLADIRLLKDCGCGMPVFLISSYDGSVRCLTHVQVDGVIHQFDFVGRLGKVMEKPLDDLLWVARR